MSDENCISFPLKSGKTGLFSLNLCLASVQLSSLFPLGLQIIPLSQTMQLIC